MNRLSNTKFGLPPIECGWENLNCIGGYIGAGNSGLVSWYNNLNPPPFLGTNTGNNPVNGNGTPTTTVTPTPTVTATVTPTVDQTLNAIATAAAPNSIIDQLKANPGLTAIGLGLLTYLIVKG